MPDWKLYVREHLSPLALGPDRETQIVEEMAQHLEAVYDEKLNEGLSEQDAFRNAAAHIRDWTLLECELVRAKHPIAASYINHSLSREVRVQLQSKTGGIHMNSIMLDLRFAVRMLLKHRAFTAVAVFSLALGIGANTAMFSLIDAVLLKNLPVRKPAELVLFNWLSGPRAMIRGIDGYSHTDKTTGMRTSTSFSYLAFERMHDSNTMLSDVFAFAPLSELNVNVDGQSEIESGQLVSGGYYDGLGVRPMIGRTISLTDDVRGAAPVVVITHRLWQRRFGSDPDIAGKTIVINRIPTTIIGVTPPEFSGALQIGTSADLSLPLSIEPQLNLNESRLAMPWLWWLRIMGRVNPGVSQEQARVSLEGAFQQSAQEGWDAALVRFPPRAQPAPRDIPALRIGSGSQGLIEARRVYSEPLVILTAIVGFVLLIACANVANLLLSRAAGRRREIAVRLAIGASRFRLVRQLLTESLLLALAGGAAGLLVAYWSKDFLLALRPWGSGRLVIDLNLDTRVLAFTTAISLITGVLFGLAPALRATKIDLTPALKDNAKSIAGDTRSILTRSLIVLQVALSLLLVIGAGLFVQTLRNLERVDTGFNRENLLLFSLEPELSGYKESQLAPLYKDITDRIEKLPGVSSATVSLIPLLSGRARTSSISVQGHSSAQGNDDAKVNHVGESFFKTLEIPILIGRSLNERDDTRSPKVAVVNQSFARRYFGDENPLGGRFGFGGVESSGEIEIVGVSGDAKYVDLKSEIEPTVYVPYQQRPPAFATFIVRTTGNPLSLVTPVRDEMHELDSNLPLFEITTQRLQAEESLTEERLFATLSSLLGGLALLLACIGLYGVMSYSVERRTGEIGIRMAMGASAARVKGMVMRETLAIVTIGLIIGLAAAFACTRLISSMLFGLAPTDPITLLFAMVALISVSAVAGYLPARRAAAVDPIVALRYE